MKSGSLVVFDENDEPHKRGGKDKEDNYCYTSNVIVRVIDATGENETNGHKNKFPVVYVEGNVAVVNLNLSILYEICSIITYYIMIFFSYSNGSYEFM